MKIDADAATDRFVRRAGRPRNEWAGMLQKEAYRLVPNHVALMQAIQCPEGAKRFGKSFETLNFVGYPLSFNS